MRLIDADAFNDWMLSHFTEPQNALVLTLQGLIAEQPTAYDVDKVVEQLEASGQKMSESKSTQKYGKSSPGNHRYYKAVSVKRAVEIVKGGGVNE